MAGRSHSCSPKYGTRSLKMPPLQKWDGPAFKEMAARVKAMKAAGSAVGYTIGDGMTALSRGNNDNHSDLVGDGPCAEEMKQFLKCIEENSDVKKCKKLNDAVRRCHKENNI